MNNLKVIHFTNVLNRGGTEMMLLDLVANSDDSLEHQIVVNYKSEEDKRGELDALFEAHGVQILYLKNAVADGYFRYIRNVYRTLKPRLNNTSVAHIHLNAKSGVPAFICKALLRIPVVVHSHAVIVYRGSHLSVLANNIEAVCQKILIRLINPYKFACSISAGKSLFGGFKPGQTKKHFVFNNAIDLKKFPNESRFARSMVKQAGQKLVLGSLGRVVRHKKVDVAIRLLERLREEGFNAKLLIGGRYADSAYKCELESLAKELHVFEFVIFLGSIDDVPGFFKQIDVFVSPSIHEGFGIVGLEAQACHCFTLLSNGFPKLVDMECGLVRFVDKDASIDVWLSQLLGLIRQEKPPLPKIHETIIKRGFSASHNAKAILDTYKKIVTS